MTYKKATVPFSFKIDFINDQIKEYEKAIYKNPLNITAFNMIKHYKKELQDLKEQHPKEFI